MKDAHVPCDDGCDMHLTDDAARYLCSRCGISVPREFHERGMAALARALRGEGRYVPWEDFRRLQNEKRAARRAGESVEPHDRATEALFERGERRRPHS